MKIGDAAKYVLSPSALAGALTKFLGIKDERIRTDRQVSWTKEKLSADLRYCLFVGVYCTEALTERKAEESRTTDL